MNAGQGKNRVAAFFDLDGTLFPLPSLERRFAGRLRDEGAIPLRNYFLWLGRAVRLGGHGLVRMSGANKMYLRDVPVSWGADVFADAVTDVSAITEAAASIFTGLTGTQSLPGSGLTGVSVLPRFFPGALDRLARHAAQGHTIVLVTGTLEPLAKHAALALTLRLLIRDITASVGVCATRLEEIDGRWSGRITGEAIFGDAKTRAVQRIAACGGFDLARCYAYGNATDDRWMLAAVGRPAAVNPSRELERIARLRSWPILRWKEKESRRAATATKTEGGRGVKGTVIPKMNSEIVG
jgi:phosphoserine phosphatase